jgi:hypothetical protein
MELFKNLVQEFSGALDRAVAAHKNRHPKTAALRGPGRLPSRPYATRLRGGDRSHSLGK